MHYIPNPLLTLLLHREERTILTWRFIVLLISLISAGGTILLLIIMLNTDDYYVREDYESAFVVGYLLFIGFSLVMPLIMAVFSAILTTTWTSRDEKFDLLRLTPLHERAFVETYFVAVLHRLRLLIGVQAILSLLIPVAVLVTAYWSDHPTSAYYTGYYYDNYDTDLSITLYFGIYILFLLVNIALAGISLIGGILGVWFGINARTTTNAIVSSVSSTCGSYLVLAVCVAGGLVLALTLVLPDTFFIQNTTGAFVASYFCIGMVCFVPLAVMWVNFLKLAQRAVRRD